ncbi:MAG: hypothetical protein BWZ10_01095 [candidate division BRC1 bacterium ADurb.BinA364]|nr:MAG: hypothetical protein BWZ10_01095 [candidate division BRC1 bacterium ADurb.BinA364]
MANWRLALFSIFLLFGLVLARDCHRSLDTRLQEPNLEFATPQGTLRAYFERAGRPGLSYSYIESILSCMSIDDARWFLRNVLPIAMSGPRGLQAATWDKKTLQLKALEWMIRRGPPIYLYDEIRVFSNGREAVAYLLHGGSSSLSVQLAREGENWKILDWFGIRYSELADEWLRSREFMGEALSPSEKLWLDGPGKDEHAAMLAAFHRAVGAPPPGRKWIPSFEAPAEFADWIRRYLDAANRFALGAAPLGEMLLFFSLDDRRWFERYWQDIARIAQRERPGGPLTREAALAALLGDGPLAPEGAILDARRSGDDAWMRIEEQSGGESGADRKKVDVPLVFEDGGWRVRSFFFMRLEKWEPAIYEERERQGIALASDELDARFRLADRLREARSRGGAP